MRRYDTVIFDLGRVLVNVEPERGLFGLIGSRLRENVEDVLPVIIDDPMIKRHNCGEISSYDFYLHIMDVLGLDLSYDEFVSRWCDIFSPIDEMSDFLVSLQGRYKIGLLSDTDRLHWWYIRNNYRFIERIERPTLSFEIGCCKPESRAYLTACEMNETVPERAIFIDDLERNVEGASAVGLRSIRHKSSVETIRALTELLEL